MDEGNNVDLIYLNLSQAFDKVPFERLFKKLESHGIGGTIWSWVKDWLSNRRQRVCIDGVFSEWGEVTSGVPQGLILGPLLFVIYIHDLDTGVIFKLDKFADDSKLGKSISSQEDVMKWSSWEVI